MSVFKSVRQSVPPRLTANSMHGLGISAALSGFHFPGVRFPDASGLALILFLSVVVAVDSYAIG